MRNQNNAFHLAVPCRDLQEAVDFYENKLGCENHQEFFRKDPSNNILEFKYYPNKEMMH